MTERRKLFSLLFIAFLVLVLPIALLLSRQRQEIRKKAYDNTGLQQHNLRANKTTVPQGQTIDIYIEADGQSYGYILGTLAYDTAYFEPVGVFSPVSSAHSFGAATSQIFRFGANNKTALLSGQMLKLTLRARQTGITNIYLAQGSVGVKLDGTYQNFTSTLGAATGISVAITPPTTPAITASPTLAPNSGVIILGSPTRSGNTISFPINFNASSTPYSGEFRVFFNSSELTYASVVKGNKTTTLNYYGTDTNGSIKNANFGVTGFTAASGGAAVLNFTLASGVQTASITIKNAEIPGLVYLKSSSAVKFPSISCAPSVGGNCVQTYSTITPSPTPTATPVATISPTPTATLLPAGSEPINSVSVSAVQPVMTGNTITAYKTTVTVAGNPAPLATFGGETPARGCMFVRLIGARTSAPVVDIKNTLASDNAVCLNQGQSYEHIFAADSNGQAMKMWATFHNDSANMASNYWPNLAWSIPQSSTVMNVPLLPTPGTGGVTISNLTHTMNIASNPAPNVTVSFNTNVQALGSWVLTLPNGDKICPPDASLTCVANREDFRHTTPATAHSFSAGSLVAGTYTYQVWAASTGGTPVSQTGSFTVTTTNSTPTPTPATTNLAGDVNGNNCIGGYDVSYVAGHYQTSTQCTPTSAPLTPVGASNGDFNRDGCVDYRDFTIVVEGRNPSCQE